MKRIKRYISVLVLTVILATSCLAIIPSAAAEPTLSTNKTVYEVGEPILVSASSQNSGKHDWVGILPKGGERWGTIRWIYISDMKGEVDITKVANGTSNSFLAPYKKFPAGEYTVYLMPDDLSVNGNESKALAKVDIRIGDEDEFVPVKMKVPTAAECSFTRADEGFADGEITITLPSGHNAENIYMFWGNENGRLEGYGRVARCKIGSSWTTSAVCEIREGIFIPEGATSLLMYAQNGVHGISEEYYAMQLPDDVKAYKFPEEKPLMEFQVVSDAHISTALHAEHFESMLKDIAKNSPDSAGIFAIGDMVEQGSSAVQWNTLWSIYDSVEGAPNMYLGMGNHEAYGFQMYSSVLDTFLENLRLPEGYEKPDTPYYDLWIGGIHFIFLGDSELPVDGQRATIGYEQYGWLAEKLAENADGRPIFLFMHQPLRDTVAGSYADQGWWGIEDGDVLRAMLEEYPQVIMFNGHTHWTLDTETSMYGSDETAVIFNTASVGYLWSSYYRVAGEYLEGSQGYYVKIYEDMILVQGRDFAENEWIPTAQFMLSGRSIPEDVGGNDIALPDENPSEKPSEKPTEDATEKPTDKPTEQATEQATEQVTEQPTEESTPTTAATGSQTATDSGENDGKTSGGCGSSIAACGAVVLVSLMGLALVCSRKRA